MILLGLRTNYIKGYGFYSDITGDTICGIPKDLVLPYLVLGYELKTEFIEDVRIPKHEVIHSEVPYHVIPRGTLKVWVI